jgi:hypothetical protein
MRFDAFQVSDPRRTNSSGLRRLSHIVAPLEGFPSSEAVPHHCGHSLPDVRTRCVRHHQVMLCRDPSQAMCPTLRGDWQNQSPGSLNHSRTDEAPTHTGEPIRAPTSSTVAAEANDNRFVVTTVTHAQTRLSRGHPPKWSSDAVPKHRANRAIVPDTESTSRSPCFAATPDDSRMNHLVPIQSRKTTSSWLSVPGSAPEARVASLDIYGPYRRVFTYKVFLRGRVRNVPIRFRM